MRTYIKWICLLPLWLFFACTDEYHESYLANKPIYMSYEALRTAVKLDNQRSIVNPGRIYFQGNTLYVVENYVGVHILDVENPKQPEQVGFLTIPGCTDLGIRNHTLYANSYVDLVAVDISDLTNIQETARKENVFPYAIPTTDNEYPIAEIEAEKGVIINWELGQVDREIKPDPEWYYYPVYDMAQSEGAFLNSGSTGGGASTGTAGSMATFGLYDNYLYILSDYYSVLVYDVSDSKRMEMMNLISANAQAETLFIYDKHLFLGTTTGVAVFSLAVPVNPTPVAQYRHLTACDPVVIRDGYAYYTLRGGNTCGSNINRLDVLKLSDDYRYNDLIASYSMTEPYGLGIDGNTLFVCDGQAGLKVYDVTDKTHIASHQLAEFPEIIAYDVIPVNGYLFAIGKNGFFLYDYSDIQNIRTISIIPVTGTCSVMY